VVDLTAKPSTAQGLKTTEDNWDDVVAFTTVSVMDGENEVKTSYVRKMTSTTVDGGGNTTEYSRYELFDTVRGTWTQFVINDWVVKTDDSLFQAIDEYNLNLLYDGVPEPEPEVQEQQAEEEQDEPESEEDSTTTEE
jgi:hypothetical protein